MVKLLVSEILHFPSEMESNTSVKVMKGYNMLFENAIYETSQFEIYLAISKQKDHMGAHSMIPPKVTIYP